MKMERAHEVMAPTWALEVREAGLEVVGVGVGGIGDVHSLEMSLEALRRVLMDPISSGDE